MKKYISIIFAVLIVISICCGCSLFGSDSNNGVLNIPGKGQKYYKRVVYKGDENSSITAKYQNNYLTVFDYIYDQSSSQSKNKSVLFDNKAKICFDGADDKLTNFYVNNDKIINSDYDSDNDTVKYYIMDINGSNKKEFFSGYNPLDYRDGFWLVSNNNQKCGIINENGEEVIPCKYDSMSLFDKKGYAIIYDSKEEKYGMIDKENNVVIPINYIYLVPFNANVNGYYSHLYLPNDITYDYTLVQTSGDEVYTIDRQGNKIFDVENSDYKSSSGTTTLTQNLLPVEKNSLYGFIDMQGNEVIPLKYNNIKWDFVNGYACVSIGGNYGIINAKGEEILPFEYSSIDPFDQNGLAVANREDSNNQLVIDLAGNIAYETSNSIEALGGGYFKESSNSGTEIIQITTDGGNYETYLPKEFTKD